MTDVKLDWLKDKVDVSKAVQKRRREQKNKAWRLYLKARDAFRRRRQITRARVLRLRKYRASLNPAGNAVKWALSQVGTTESPPYSNRGAKIDEWNRKACGVLAVPWCQSFADAVYVSAGGPQIPSAYTVAVVQYARDGRFGLSVVYDRATSKGRILDWKPGDFVYFKFPAAGAAGDYCDHVGVYVGDSRTAEGNTSYSNTGSQSNGGVVAIRTRPSTQIVAVVRPNY